MLIFFYLDIDHIWHYFVCIVYILVVIVQWTRNSGYDKTTHWFLYSLYDLSGLSSRIVRIIVYAWIVIMILLVVTNSFNLFYIFNMIFELFRILKFWNITGYEKKSFENINLIDIIEYQTLSWVEKIAVIIL